MNKSIFFISLVLVLSVVIHVLFKYIDSHAHTNLLSIGILSAQSNSYKREVLRKSWLKNISSDISYYFIIGKIFCNIPPDDRIDEYSCEELQINLPDQNYNNIQYSGELTCTEEGEKKQVFWGYNFITHYDIVIHKFGVLSDFIKGSVKITLQETATRMILTSALFTNEQNNSRIYWKSSDMYLLPKGFEGRITVETNFTSDQWSECGFNWKSYGNLLKILYLFNSPEELPLRFTSYSFSPVVFGFKIQDVGKLREFLDLKNNRQKLWNASLSHLSHNLDREAKEKGDIVFLDVIDVYRNLPQKMLLFFKWVYYNAKFSFLLKTDDDTFINIPLVQKELMQISENNTHLCEKIWWWSTFRIGWAVQSFGKWREHSYQSLTYPPFPCGSGYILSQETVKFLAINAENLCNTYQGEDVSLGIWLSAVHPSTSMKKISSCIWNCGDSSSEVGACNYPELSSEQIIEIHKKLQSKEYT